MLGISEQTFHTWKREHEEFALAIKRSKDVINDQVEASLIKRATASCPPFFRGRRGVNAVTARATARSKAIRPLPAFLSSLRRHPAASLGKVACRHRISLPTGNPARVLGRVAGFLVCHAIHLGRG